MSVYIICGLLSIFPQTIILTVCILVHGKCVYSKYWQPKITQNIFFNLYFQYSTLVFSLYSVSKGFLYVLHVLSAIWWCECKRFGCLVIVWMSKRSFFWRIFLYIWFLYSEDKTVIIYICFFKSGRTCGIILM